MSEWERFVYDRTARMTVPVSINGTAAVPFIIDTGSERTVISRELAATLTLPPAHSILLATVSGPVMADSYRIRDLTNGGFAVRDIVAPALSRRHMGIDGLIGIESVQDKIIVFDFAGQRMLVLPSRATPLRDRRDEGAIIVTAKRKHGRLILSDARIGGHRVDLVIDTGSQSSVGNLALRRMIETRSGTTSGVASSLIDVGGTLVATEANALPEITIGKITLARLPIAYADSYALEVLGLGERPAMLLGMDALSLFDRVEIDFHRRKIRFVMPELASGERASRRPLNAVDRSS
jgi:predicted aspartyl protease